MSAYQKIDVVIVDDNEESADLLAMLIQLQDHTALATYGGAEGIEAVTRLRPRLIITDLSMPNISGINVLCAVRSINPNYEPIVASISGWDDPAQQVPGEVRGFNLHFTKPVSYDAIKVMLDLIDTDKL
jgi:CheY-like chemotaxis protein